MAGVVVKSAERGLSSALPDEKYFKRKEVRGLEGGHI